VSNSRKNRARKEPVPFSNMQVSTSPRPDRDEQKRGPRRSSPTVILRLVDELLSSHLEDIIYEPSSPLLIQKCLQLVGCLSVEYFVG
jgi:hypothetical protein